MGDDHDLGPEVAAALTALVEALSTDEVSGFATRPVRSFVYDSASRGTGLGFDRPSQGVHPKVEEVPGQTYDGIAGGDLGSGR